MTSQSLLNACVITRSHQAVSLKNQRRFHPTMSTVMPDSENVQKAIKWISANLEESGSQPLHMLIEKAVFKFDLSPKDSEFIMGFFRNHKKA